MQDPVNILEPASALLVLAPMVVFFVIAAVPVYFLYRFLRAYERRGATAAAANTSNADARIATLEAQVERLANEVEQLTEGQRFTAQLLQRPKESVHGSLKQSPD